MHPVESGPLPWGLLELVEAIPQLAKVDGDQFDTAIGCPSVMYCG
jgi:hypothetical protein